MGRTIFTAEKPRVIRLDNTHCRSPCANLNWATSCYLDGLMYTAREGVYQRALEEQANIPMELPRDSAANFHCSPAATIREDGSLCDGCGHGNCFIPVCQSGCPNG